MRELLEATKRTIAGDTYPGYPSRRLIRQDLDKQSGMTLPDGEWSTGVFVYPTLAQQKMLRGQGYELDELGRPLHPWLAEMLDDPAVGVVTGLGEYWHWGPNRTADPVVIGGDSQTPKVLLIKRGDTGSWALPGGFIDGDEPAVDAARRELCEETGLIVHGDALPIYEGVVADGRTTAHAWAETSALVWRIDGTPEVRGGDDAQEARWFAYDELPVTMHGSHAILVEAAFSRWDEAKLSHALSIPAVAESYREATGGHMAYRRHIVVAKDGLEYFVKSHDRHAFTDPLREAHSHHYLQKEGRMYGHLREQGYEHIPDTVDVIDGHTLAMTAYTTDMGWHWRAPREHLDLYTRDVMAALESLGTVTPPGDFEDAEGPSHHILTELGWNSIGNSEIRAIRQRLEEWLTDFSDRFHDAAVDLSRNIATLRSTDTHEPTVMTHHDFRQANIAWHPDHGVRIVDWSWAGLGAKDSDATMLLIDLHKSGHDVSAYMDRFNREHALTLVGYWLALCTAPPRDPSSTVRFQQALSAVCAYDLLMKYR